MTPICFQAVWTALQIFISNESFKPITEYKEISEGSEIILDELKFKVIETPGHTKGSVCYLCND
ncbi:Zn-dependent hydrolase, including glyoxylase, partial [human gut metagenome]